MGSSSFGINSKHDKLSGWVSAIQLQLDKLMRGDAERTRTESNQVEVPSRLHTHVAGIERSVDKFAKRIGLP